jgi:glycosyltransferase involved in cell wall biosynthesis
VTTAHSVSAVVPVYNERAALAPAIDQIDRYLAGHVAAYEIIVVESGSTDGTAEACDELTARHPHVRVHHEGRRNGFGSAVRAGAGLATKDWIWPLVVDMPFALESLDLAIPYLDSYDCVLSYRSQDPRGAYRRFQSAVFNGLARRLLGVRVRHVNSAFKLVRRPVMRSLELTSNGWLLDAELLMGLQQRGTRFVEIPVPLVPRVTGRSTIGPKAVARAVVDLFSLAARRRHTAASAASERRAS